MASKTNKSDKQKHPGSDPLAGANAAQELARRFAALSPPADTLRNISEGVAAYSGIAKAVPSADEIARAISQASAAADAIRNLNVSLPKVDLKLPDLSKTIQASLPRPLPVLPLQPTPPLADAGRETATPDAKARRENTVQIDMTQDLGQMVRCAREARGLSQQAFADLAGVGRRFISELENGKATLEFGKVLKAARAAGIALLARDR